MSSDIAISVRGVSKHYLMFERPEDRLKQMVVPRLQRAMGIELKRYFQDFAALQNISFEIKRGETVGIIGRNGCGKSTLLQIVCGTLQPTSGTVEVNGRIAALLELGAGFNPEFTGRENVYMNAAILGMSREETDERFDDIARFADIGIFIDQPVKTFSSGMYVRLAFAVAINVDPDILVVDEALAVGDEAFQRKCFARIEDIRANGGTILFVSHGAQTILQLCDHAILLDRGEKILEGRPKTVVNQYQRFINLSDEEAGSIRDEIKAMDGWASAPPANNAEVAGEGDAGTNATALPGPTETDGRMQVNDGSWYDPNLKSDSRVEYESKGARIRDVQITTTDGRRVNVLCSGGAYQVSYVVEFEETTTNCLFGMQVKALTGMQLAGANNATATTVPRPDMSRGDQVAVTFRFACRFLPGTYAMDVGVMGTRGGETDFVHRLLDVLMFRVQPMEDTLAVGIFDIEPHLLLRRVGADYK
ncbi:ABC transporter ATP-binding protein [Tepidamorphus sp. 3E244]|uniref:ABC transporter ATP-binding protein n=1 Tax=Tepidamorphus sp. 3E244 TaxID=3385498 RepID=UPI0038FCD44B